MSCLFLGDSIALGAGNAYNTLYQEQCEIHAVQGIGSNTIVSNMPNNVYSFVVVSAGVNDPKNTQLKNNYMKIKRKYSSNIIWILPYNSDVRTKLLSLKFNDKFISLPSVVGTNDGVHPKSYYKVAYKIKQINK